MRRRGRRAGRAVHVIAESDLNDPRLLLPPERGGYGLDAQWSDDFHHAVHAYLTGERQGYYQDFGRTRDLAEVFQEPFLYDGTYSAHRGRKHGAPARDLGGERFIVAIQNHDQVGNRARGDRLATLLTPPAQRLAASLLLLAPHLPLLFMGEEYGEERPFLFFCSFCDARLVQSVREGRQNEFACFAWQGEVPDPHAEGTFASSRLSWSWPEGSRQAGLRRLYADLLSARRKWPALAVFCRRCARLLPDENTGSVLELVRGARPPEGGGLLQVVFNLVDRPQPLAEGVGTNQEVVFSSEAGKYQGSRARVERLRELLPYECVAFGPRGWQKFA
jgi:maltooligosyltrehalose trehalohydrolase